MKISVNGLSFSYGANNVLEDIDFSIGKGELVGIIGSNGSGKSTLLRCMNKILSPKTGTIMVDGKESSKLSCKEVSRLFGYVPQVIPSDFSMTVFDTVLMGRRPHVSYRPGEEDIKKTSEVLSLFDLDDISMKNIDELSGGQRQKVFIARSLAQDPNVVLLDEPTANLDMRHQIESMDIIKNLSFKGMSVVVAMHDLNLAARFCDKVIMLKKGKVFDAGSKDILHSENIKEVYGVDADILFSGDHPVIIPKLVGGKECNLKR
ncbi:MAG: ABC transporter ATP-binding protein [Nanobdellota archaeon]